MGLPQGMSPGGHLEQVRGAACDYHTKKYMAQQNRAWDISRAR